MHTERKLEGAILDHNQDRGAQPAPVKASSEFHV
jgi:hypothetical protein